jgi:hypothetical protein
MSMTLEDLIKLIALLGIPAITAVAWLITMLMSIKADLKKIEVQLDLKHTMNEDRISRLEKGVYEVRSSMQTVVVGLARKGLHDEQHQG